MDGQRCVRRPSNRFSRSGTYFRDTSFGEASFRESNEIHIGLDAKVDTYGQVQRDGRHGVHNIQFQHDEHVDIEGIRRDSGGETGRIDVKAG